MKTHLPSKLRAALLAAIFACSVQSVSAVTYTEDTAVNGAISENITVNSGVTVNVNPNSSDNSAITGSSLVLGSDSNVVLSNGYVTVGNPESDNSFTVSGNGTITNNAIFTTSDNLLIQNATLINNSDVVMQGDSTLQHAVIDNNGDISFDGRLSATNSTINNADGTLNIYGAADITDSKLINGGKLIFHINENSRTGKALLTIDESTVRKSGLAALPTGLMKVTVDAANSLGSVVGNTYHFVDIAGVGYLGASTEVDILGGYEQVGTSSTYRHQNGAYYFTMDKIMGADTMIAVSFSKDAAFIQYVDDDNCSTYGDIVYTTEEIIYGSLNVGDGSSVTMNNGAALTIDNGSLNVADSGAFTINGGTLTFAPAEDSDITPVINGSVQINITGDTTADTAIISGLSNDGYKNADISVLIDTSYSSALAGKTFIFTDGDALSTENISASTGSINWESGIIGIGGDFGMQFTYENGAMTFGDKAGVTVTTGGAVTGNGMLVADGTVIDDNTVLSLEQQAVSGETIIGTTDASAADTAIADAGSVLASDFNSDSTSGDTHVNVVYGKDVTLSSGNLEATSLSTTVKDGNTTIAQSTDSLVLTFTSDTKLENGTLGFGGEANGEVVSITTQNGTESKLVVPVDIIKNEGNKVTLTNMEVTVDRALEMEDGEMTLKGTRMTLGGHKLTDEEYKQLHIGDGANKQTVHIETDNSAEAHLDLHTNTKVNGGKITMDGTEGFTSFQAGYMKDAQGNLDKDADTSVEFIGSEINLKDKDRGHGGKHQVVLGGHKETHQTIKMHGVHLHGTGHVQNVHMNGGRLGIGNSPGVMSITDTDFSGTEWTFHLITNPTDTNWVANGANTTPGDAFSQLKLDGANTASGITILLNYQTESNGTYANTDSSAFGVDFEIGSSITLIDTSKGTITGDYKFAEYTLPKLDPAAGIIWDTSRLFSTGAIYVIADLIGDPSRIANTMVAAAGTTGTFGRLGMQQLDAPRLNGTNVWAQAYASCQDRNSTDGRNGFDSNATGFAVGVDKQLRKMPLIIGAALGTSNGTIKPNRGTATYTAGKIDQDGMQMGLYGRYMVGTPDNENSLLIDGYLTYGSYENDSYRSAYATGKAATASWDEHAWAMGVTVSRNYKFREHTFITPYAGIEYTTAEMHNFTERSNGSVRYSERDAYRNLAAVIGVSANRSFGLSNGQTLTPYANVSLSQDIMRQDAKVTAYGAADSITDESAHQGRTALQFSVGANWQIDKNWSMNAGYSIETREDAVDQNANIGASYAF